MSPSIPLPTGAIKHRPDIDGLRAVAILPILLLHCGFARLKGGFVGVDIFFVISGYLITGIVQRELGSGTFSFSGFYRRRIVRLLPALVVMLMTTLLLGSALLLPRPLADLGRSAAATGALGSNVYFFATSDYFAASSDGKPLIHTWSLAVEEQFYILYPLLLIWLCKRSDETRRTVLILVSAGSFAAGAWLAAVEPSAGFFLLPARIWELLLGALVATGVFTRFDVNGRLRNLACIAALLVLAVCVFETRSGWPFPVPFAAPVALATALLLAWGETGVSARILSLAPLRLIGLVSYSIYLWHRPIIAYYQWETGSTLDGWEPVALVITCLIVGFVSWYLVEQPAMRAWRNRQGRMVQLTGLATLATIVLTGLAISHWSNAIRPLSPSNRIIASYLGFDTTDAAKAQFGTDRCFTIPTGQPFDSRACLALSATRPNVLLLGDSHAAQLSQGLRQALPSTNLLQATAAGCRPLIDGKGLARCRTVVDNALQGLDLARIDTVILAGRWLDEETPDLLQTISAITSRGPNVIVVGPMVEYDLDMPALLVRAVETGDPGLPQRFRLREREELDSKLARRVPAAGARYVSVVQNECQAGTCRLLEGSAPLRFDHSHLTPPAARQLAARIADYVSSGLR